MRLLLSGLLFSVLIWSACKTEQTAGRPLVETHWLFSEVDGDTTGIEGISPRPYMLIRPGTNGLRFQVFAGCNNILGHIETDSLQELRFNRIASTRKSCLQMKLETRIQGILPMVDGFRIKGESLELLDGQQIMLRLDAGPEAIQ